MKRLIAAFFAVLVQLTAAEYFGVQLGRLKNEEYSISATVFYANESMLQIVGFNMDPTNNGVAPRFFFSTEEASHPALNVYLVQNSSGGPYLKKISPIIDSGFQDSRLIVEIPKAKKIDWTHMGIASEKNWKYLAAVRLNSTLVPQPFCCITNPGSPWRGIVGQYYGAATEPIQVIDTKTILLPGFRFKGTQPPDGWVFSGRGPINQKTGKKALILGRDEPGHHCGIHEDYDGSKDLIARLADGQTIYDVDYVAIFCYQYDVDFGHIQFQLDPESNPVPVFIPPVSDRPLPKIEPGPHC